MAAPGHFSRSLGEVSGSFDAIEAKKAAAGKDFGELVRERRRQRGLHLPVAEKILPFRLALVGASSRADAAEVGEERVAEAWTALQAAEAAGRPRRVLLELEAAFLQEVTACDAARACR